MKKLNLEEMIKAAMQESGINVGGCETKCNKECQGDGASLKITIEMTGCPNGESKPIVLEGLKKFIILAEDGTGVYQKCHCDTEFVIQAHAILLSDMLDKMSAARRMSSMAQSPLASLFAAIQGATK